MDQVQIDIQQGGLAGRLMNDVGIPDLLEQRTGGHWSTRSLQWRQ
jgi:hypothetical protein